MTKKYIGSEKPIRVIYLYDLDCLLKSGTQMLQTRKVLEQNERENEKERIIVWID